jgi:hypothetical protein
MCDQRRIKSAERVDRGVHHPLVRIKLIQVENTRLHPLCAAYLQVIAERGKFFGVSGDED